MNSMEKFPRFVAFEGADGVGKSTVLRLFVPAYLRQTGCDGFLFFHWKPIPSEIAYDRIPESTAQDPRAKCPRNAALSFAFLLYHAFGYLWGYWTKLRPALRKNKLIIADRYAYDMLLDPARFRLGLSPKILRAVIQLLPRPDIIIALTAPAEVIRKRKPELSKEEILAYQSKLASLPDNPHLELLDASETPERICERILRILAYQNA